MDNGHTFNLISTPWLPVIRASGRRGCIRPADLTDGINADPILDLDFSRADFRCATFEFLIGLLTVACAPRDDWAGWWTQPPSKAELEIAFGQFEAVFNFDGEGSRAYQDYEDFATKPTPVEALLIEAPGAEAVKKNTAFLVKAGRVLVLSRRAAASALLTLQTVAPSGGRGYRPSLRGGGPLTTLVVLKAPITLWHRLWVNVPVGEKPPASVGMPQIFPWLAPTCLSKPVTPEDVDWRLVFFGMPRRIRLDFTANVERSPCDLTGEIDSVIVRTFRTLPQSVNYNAWGGRHPLTPHKRKPHDPGLYPVLGQDGHFGYRQWMALLYGDNDKLREPAACISLFTSHRKDDLPRDKRSFRLVAAGYAMVRGQAKVLSFIEAETPDITVPEDGSEAVAEKARDFVAAANEVAKALGHAVKIALYGEDADKRIQRLNDTTPLTTARDRFWVDTNDRFFATLNAFSTMPAEELTGDAATPVARTWRADMERASLAIFDDMAPMQDALSPNVKRVVDGRRFLVRTLLGYGVRGVELFKHLQLPVPEIKTRKGKAA